MGLESSQLSLLRELQRNTTDRLAYQKLTVMPMLRSGFSRQTVADKQCIDPYVDNARCHHSKQVAQYLDSPRIRLHFLPPCSPNLNPIERLWKLLKREVVKSRHTPSLAELRQRISDFFTHIGNCKDQFGSLINTNFQLLEPANAGPQYSL